MSPEQLTGQTESHLTEMLIGEKYFLTHPQVQSDLHRLVEAAHAAGFKLEIASGFRSYARQASIWNNKFSGQRTILDSNSQPINFDSLSEQDRMWAILRWSALQGASRHHWGCDFDVFSRTCLPGDTQLQLEPWEYLTGHQKAFYDWMLTNLEKYHFFFPYSKDLGGVAIEPWHISHRSISKDCLSLLSPLILGNQLLSEPILGQANIIAQLDNIYSQFIGNISD